MHKQHWTHSLIFPSGLIFSSGAIHLQGTTQNPLAAETPVPIEILNTRVALSKHKQTCKEGLHFYCCKANHLLTHCASWPRHLRRLAGTEGAPNTNTILSGSPPKPLLYRSFKIDALIQFSESTHILPALIDSGAAGNFLDTEVAQRLQIACRNSHSQ